MAKLLVVDDHSLVRQGLVMAMRRVPGVSSVLEAGDAESALHLFNIHGEFDLVLLDLGLPGLSGFSLLGILRKRFPTVRVVVVSGRDSEQEQDRVLAAGAVAYVHKSGSSSELVDRVAEVVAVGAGKPMVEDEPSFDQIRAHCAVLAEIHQLSAARLRVLEILGTGKTNREIGEILGLTEGTVKLHVSALLKSMGLDNRTQAMLLATQGPHARTGFTAPPPKKKKILR